VPDFPSNCAIVVPDTVAHQFWKYIVEITTAPLNFQLHDLTKATLMICKISPIHGQLPAEAAYEVARILCQLRAFHVELLFSLLLFLSMMTSGIKT